VLNSTIGGVGSFLGPALGAALMTFFGYAVSDATQSWLLYQGVLFVLVMMFVPAGLSGLLANGARLVERRGWRVAASVMLLAFGATVLLSAGGVFIVEMLQRLCSQDYRSLAQAAAEWPAVRVLGRPWPPAAASTWLLPAGLLAGGGVLMLVARRRVRAAA